MGKRPCRAWVTAYWNWNSPERCDTALITPFRRHRTWRAFRAKIVTYGNDAFAISSLEGTRHDNACEPVAGVLLDPVGVKRVYPLGKSKRSGRMDGIWTYIIPENVSGGILVIREGRVVGGDGTYVCTG